MVWNFKRKVSNVIVTTGLSDTHVLPVHVATWGSDRRTAGRAIREAQTASGSQTLLQDPNS